MFDSQRHAGAATGSGDIRIAAALALAGGLLLVSTMTGLWAGPAVVPVSLAVAMLVFGGFLLLSRLGIGARGRAGRRTGIEAFESIHQARLGLTPFRGGIEEFHDLGERPLQSLLGSTGRSATRGLV
jgi:hypothetical protein